MAFKPNTTVYLCTGTGMDAANSIWWHRFAYPNTVGADRDDSWWNTCYQFFKSHSIAEGNWYCTYLDPSRGYFRFGRQPLVDRHGDIPQGEEGLGSVAQQAYIDNNNIPVAETIRAVDYIVFVNDGDGVGGSVNYAFVDQIVSLNWNTCLVYFTIDAIMTYQPYFYFGPSMVLRDMEFQERMGQDHGIPNIANENTQPEPFEPSESDYVFQRITDASQVIIQRTEDMGPFFHLFVTSDVSLEQEDITPNAFYGGLPSFKACEASRDGEFNLGIGGYYVPYRKNEVFDLLGSYNAMEHVLYSYTCPMNLFDQSQIPPLPNVGTTPRFIENFRDIIDTYFRPTENPYDDDHTLRLPIDFNDDATREDCSPAEGNYQPVNLKTYQAPYSYLSVADRMGGSLEVPIQNIVSYTPSEEYYYRVPFIFNFTGAPNAMSCLYIADLKQMLGSWASPMLVNLQMPSYVMTPNNSGYNNNAVSAWTNMYTGVAQIAVGSAFNSIAVGQDMLLKAGSALATVGIGAAVGAGSMSALGGVGAKGALGGIGSLNNPIKQVASGLTGSGVSALSAGVANVGNYFQNKIFGLPKTVGGLPNGYNTIVASEAGFNFFWVHMRTKLIKTIDRAFSMFGYAQNMVRYPHINIRKHWCYVQLQNVNIIPIPANDYDPGGVPFWAREQIETRMKNGVTFWNIRYALMGDGDSGPSSVQSWDDGAIQSANKCKWVKNYGGGEAGNDIEWENVSYFGGYATDYTDDYNPQE